MSNELQEQSPVEAPEQTTIPVASESPSTAQQPPAQPESEAKQPDAEHQQDAAPDQSNETVEKSETKDDQEPQKKPNRTREYIQNLRERAATAERERDELLERLQRQPDYDEDDYEAAEDYRLQRNLDRRDAERAERQRREAVEQAEAVKRDEMTRTLQEAEQRLPGVSRILNDPSLTVSAAMAEFLSESDVAPELSHWIINNPNEAYAVSQLPPMQQVMAMAQRAASIQQATRTSRISKAPPPPTRIQPAAAATQKTPEEMPYGEFKDWLTKQLS